MFAVYKPKELTSNDVLNCLRHVAHTKVVGHAGTLDPLAEGVLVIAIGRESTRRLAQEVLKEKEYEAIIRLGVTSTTDDQEGEKTEQHGYVIPTVESIMNMLPQFIGTVLQMPPVYSAIKIKGKEAYKRVRAGESVVLEPRRVEIKHITVVSYEWPRLTLHITTGPGVYIRSLARDIGNVLGTGGYLDGLIRTRVGQWVAVNAFSLAQAEKCVYNEYINSKSLTEV